MSIAQKLLANPEKFSVQQLRMGVQSGSIPAYIGIPLIQQKMQEQQQMQGAMAQPVQEPPIAEQVMAAASMPPPGVTQLPSNLPVEGMAGGGIVAFAEGGDTTQEEDKPWWSRFIKSDEEKVADMRRFARESRGYYYPEYLGPPNPPPPSIKPQLGMPDIPALPTPSLAPAAPRPAPRPAAGPVGIKGLPGAATGTTLAGMNMLSPGSLDTPEAQYEKAMKLAEKYGSKDDSETGKALKALYEKQEGRMAGMKDKALGLALLQAAQGMGQGRTLGQGFAPAMGAFGKSYMESDALMEKAQEKSDAAKIAYFKHREELEAGNKKQALAAYDKYQDNMREAQKFQWMAQNYYGPMAKAATARGAGGGGKAELAAAKAEEQTLLKELTELQKDLLAVRTPEGKAKQAALAQQLVATRRKMQALAGIDVGAGVGEGVPGASGIRVVSVRPAQ